MSEECSTEGVEKKGYLDRIVEKVISRKFTVFLTATALLMWSNLTSDTWGMIAVVYIGGQSVVDIAQMWKHGA